VARCKRLCCFIVPWSRSRRGSMLFSLYLWDVHGLAGALLVGWEASGGSRFLDLEDVFSKEMSFVIHILCTVQGHVVHLEMVMGITLHS